MKRALACLVGTLVLLHGQVMSADLSTLADAAVSEAPDTASAARLMLREAGPAGLDALQQRFADLIAQQSRPAPFTGNADTPEIKKWSRLWTALNQVSGQYDDYTSGLYWYTDLEAAKKAAAATGRPILSLRLLGKLDADLSCANSRFFRTTLYPNAEVKKLLKEHFILHWESVRPVPIVTVDFGDGRKLLRTVTGNSIHYILDAQGRIVDALPGLYSATAFASELSRAAAALAEHENREPASYRAYQTASSERLRRAWAQDVAAIYPARLSGSAIPSTSELIFLTTDQTWQEIANLHQGNKQFDESTARFMEHKYPPTAQQAAVLARSKIAIELPVVRALRVLGNNVALDTVRDNYEFRCRILDHLATDSGEGLSLSTFNDWVYTDIFLTPPSDPWFGLVPADVIAAIDDDGRSEPIAAGFFIQAKPRATFLLPPN